MEIQIGYDKSIKDFYFKKSIFKLGFINNKDEQKFIFELSDILFVGILKKWINIKDLINLKEEIQENQKNLNKNFNIMRNKPININFFYPIKFSRVNIIKPSFFSEEILGDYFEIKLDYQQKASGVQGMMYFNINSNNLYKDNKTIIEKTISKNDNLSYEIDLEKFRKIFLKLFILFPSLGEEHKKDILSIINSMIDFLKNNE